MTGFRPLPDGTAIAYRLRARISAKSPDSSPHRRKERRMRTAKRSNLTILAASLLGTAMFIAAPMGASAQPAAKPPCR